ncbi:hypothetical protein K438DRAFT_1986898 [Mycena galopus ATCC 62051]|nr:hypothetical protein K438DRAFT_1986898 [Mycena galopus ATCC 62051]
MFSPQFLLYRPAQKLRSSNKIKLTVLALFASVALGQSGIPMTFFSGPGCTGSIIEQVQDIPVGDCVIFGEGLPPALSIGYAGVPSEILFFETNGPPNSCATTPAMTAGPGSGCATAPTGFWWASTVYN